MEINKQLFEDVLSGKLKGTFVLRNGNKCDFSKLHRNTKSMSDVYPYTLFGNRILYYATNGKSYTCLIEGYYYQEGYGYDIMDFISETNMKENELTIEIPQGKEIDWDESKKQNKVVLKDKQLTYEDVCKKLFKDDHYSIAWEGYPIKCCSAIYNASNATTEHQLECILAKNKLANVAKYLNDGCNLNDDKYYIILYNKKVKKPYIEIVFKGTVTYGFIMFKTKELAQQAIEILGEETVKLALEPLGV